MPWKQAIDQVLYHSLAIGQTPGAVVLVGRGEEVLYHRAVGLRGTVRPRHVMRTDTVFDLASLTKPLVTATAIMWAAERKLLTPSDHAGRWLPGMDAGITLSHLLTHSSGLPAYRDYLGGWGDKVAPAAEVVAIGGE
ncbi:MAG: serine hydrolase domain-containing protein, partial [Armatimonadota bacterium]